MDPVEQASWYQPSEQAAGGYLDVEVSASGFAVYEGPFNLFIEVSWASAVPRDHTYLQVNGSQGMARLETLFGLSPNGNRPRRPLQLYTGSLAKPEAVRGATDVLQPYRDEWRFFIKSIKSGQSLRASLYEGLAMMQLIEALYRSAEDVESGAILSPQGSIIS
jgi:predicted dehydrogenase